MRDGKRPDMPTGPIMSVLLVAGRERLNNALIFSDVVAESSRRGVCRHVASAASGGLQARATAPVRGGGAVRSRIGANHISRPDGDDGVTGGRAPAPGAEPVRSEEHTSELQSQFHL